MGNGANNLPKKVLIVDRDRSVGQALAAQMTKYNISIQSAADFESALYLFNQQRFDVCILELGFEPVSGLTVVQKFRANDQGGRSHIGVIMCSGKAGKAEDRNLSRELGDIEHIEKPINVAKLLTVLAKAYEGRLASEQLQEVKEISYQALKKTGSLENALATVNEKLAKFPGKQMELALDLVNETEEYDKGLQLIDALLTKSPNDIRLLNAKGRLLLKSGNASSAAKFFEAADQAAPNNVERIEKMAEMYLELKDPDKSLEKMKELIALQPELKDLKFNLVRDLDDAGFRQHAIKLCKATSSPKEVVRYYNNKGVMLSKVGKKEQALKDYYTALMFYPQYRENYRILFNIALAEISKKTRESYLAAEEALEKTIKMAPDFEKAKKLLVEVQARLSKNFRNVG